VLVFDKKGKLLLQFGATGMITKQGQLAGKFYFPNGVLVDRGGDIYVADSNNRRVQVFSSTGKYLRTVETAGLPRGIAIDSSDRLYVVDALGHDVSVFKKTAARGPALTVFGDQGIALGQMLYPNGLKVDDSGARIFVADRENNRVDVFEWPESEQSVLAPIKKAIPLSGLLIPPALLAFGLLNRRRRFFADRQFMNNIVQYNHLEELKSKAKKVYVSAEAYDQFKGYQEGSLKAADVMVPVKTDDEAVKAMKKAHDLDEDTASLFAGAKRGITKPRIMAETKEAHLAALDLRIESMDHELFTEFYNVKDSRARG
jgi:DNA-binding beta-propeller fold protein YncE